MTTLGSIKALRKANESQHRLIKKLTARNGVLEGVVEEILRPLNNTYQEIEKHVGKKGTCAKCSSDRDCEELTAWTHILRVNMFSLDEALVKLEEV